MEAETHARFGGRLVMVGFGSIGQAFLPLLLRHIELPRERITILAADEAGRPVAQAYGVELVVKALEPGNYRALLEPRLSRGDLLLNLSVDVSSRDLIE